MVLSKVTPKLRTHSDTGMLTSPSETEPVAPSCLRLAPVPTTVASDLSGLRVKHLLHSVLTQNVQHVYECIFPTPTARGTWENFGETRGRVG